MPPRAAWRGSRGYSSRAHLSRCTHQRGQVGPCENAKVSPTGSRSRPFGIAACLVVAGAIGFIAALALTLDKIALLENPDAQLSCSFSVLIGCSTNLNSAQGAVFGLPNPLLGLAFWAAVVTVGVAILAGAQFARWFWLLLNLGIAGSLALVVWFIAQSIFVLRVLCPWCMATWAVTIPVFLLVTLYSISSGIIPAPTAVRRAAGVAYGWIPPITVLCYLVVAFLAQWQLDVLGQVLLLVS